MMYFAPVAQIREGIDAATGTLNAAAQAGIAVLALVFVIVALVCAVLIARYMYLNSREARAAEAKQEADAAAARERREEADREARKAERQMSLDAMESANRVNALLMNRLDEQGKTQKEAADVIKQQAEGMAKMVSSLDGNTVALKKMETELHGVQTQLKELTEKVAGVRGLTDADRALIADLTGKFSSLLEIVKETYNEKPETVLPPAVTVPVPAAADNGTGAGKPDAARDGNGNTA